MLNAPKSYRATTNRASAELVCATAACDRPACVYLNGEHVCIECARAVLANEVTKQLAQGDQNYSYAVTPTDTMRAYVTDQERKGLYLALVMVNKNEDKISVLIGKDDAVRLREQLDTFIVQCAIARS